MFFVNSASLENSTENNNRTVIITEFEVEENGFLHPVQHENEEIVQSSLSQDEHFLHGGEIPVKENETIQSDLPQDEPSVIILQDPVLPFNLSVNANEKTQNSEEKTINVSVGARQFEEKLLF